VKVYLWLQNVPKILFFKYFLLHIFLNYISNAIPKVPHTLPSTSLPTHSHFFGPGVPLYWGINSLHVQWSSLSSDGRLGHLLIHMQLESRAPGYWLVHNVVPPIGLQIHLAPWVLINKILKKKKKNCQVVFWPLHVLYSAYVPPSTYT
jgi:hypothetical protein